MGATTINILGDANSIHNPSAISTTHKPAALDDNQNVEGTTKFPISITDGSFVLVQHQDLIEDGPILMVHPQSDSTSNSDSNNTGDNCSGDADSTDNNCCGDAINATDDKYRDDSEFGNGDGNEETKNTDAHEAELDEVWAEDQLNKMPPATTQFKLTALTHHTISLCGEDISIPRPTPTHPCTSSYRLTPCIKPKIPPIPHDNPFYKLPRPGSSRAEEPPIFKNSYLTISRSPLGGLGAFADVFIEKGTVVLAEIPLFRLRAGTSRHKVVNALSFDDRGIFYSLHHYDSNNHSGMLDGIIDSNSFQVHDGQAICAVASRFNHACVPVSTLGYRFDREQDMMVFTSKRDITIGTELTISYSDKCITLLGTYGFECSCGHCPQPITSKERNKLGGGSATYDWSASQSVPPIIW